MKKSNPFIISSDYFPKNFCDRENETQQILSSIKNNRNIFLFSGSGIGKSILLKKVNSLFVAYKDTVSYYINLSKIDNLLDFKEIIIKNIDNGIDVKKRNNNFDDNKISATFKVAIENAELKKTIIILDDFQKFINIAEKDEIHEFFNFVENQQNIQFIFSGNKNKFMFFLKTFNPQNDNYDYLELKTLEPNTYIDFIKKKFNKAGVKIKKSNIRLILNLTKGNTLYTQYFCNRLFYLNRKQINKGTISNLLDRILLENEHNYFTFKSLLSNYQWKLLRAIATEGEANQITSGKFIRKYSLNAPSSVKTAEKSLLEKNLIYKDNNGYHIENIFFAKWLSK